MVKVRGGLKMVRDTLQDISDAPGLDAERLLLHVLGKEDASYLAAHGDEALSPAQEAEFKKLTAERAGGKPLAYILGSWGFYGREFLVTPDVLVPRPETEHLIDTVLQYLPSIYRGESEQLFVIADIGTGSGCIGITLALELANFNFLATDISEKALGIARQNAEKYGVADRIEFLQGDMLEPLAGKQVDLIVSNPPYLPAEALAKAGCAIDTIGLDFEPRIALDGGVDGLKYVRQIKASGIPAVIETVGGEIDTLNISA